MNRSRGILGWIRSIAPMLETHHITINGICPGLVDTPILGPGGGEMMRNMGMNLLSPTEVAAAHDKALNSNKSGQAYVVTAVGGTDVFEFAEVSGYQGGGPPPGAAEQS